MLQHLINILYRYPKARLITYRRFGGFFNYQSMLRNRKRMEQASINLAPVQSYPNGLPIYFLTGKNYLYQTLFCIQSLNKVTEIKLNFILVDDGSFDKLLITQINRQLPGSRIVGNDEITKNLELKLPADRYPVLNHKRKIYPHLKKLTDIHTVDSKPWKLVLDSDMLFWKEPSEMLKWLQQPEEILYMLDSENSYGYTPGLMQDLVEAEVPEKINVGTIGLNSDTINWDKLELWINTLEQAEGATYYLEQALTAMLITGNSSKVLSSADYIVNPNNNEIANRLGTLHHYVDLSKEMYFKTAWRHFIKK